ncbi:MAG: signal peptidase II [Chloroflexi bacterium]|nr:signal peptidase II [Chloroflexota bacterium]
MRRYLRDYSFLALIAGLVITLDQISKAYVRSHLQLGQMWAPWDWLMPYARIVYWSNTGVAFGMFQGRGQLFTLLSLLISIAIIYYFPRVSNGDWALRLAMGLQLGGAVGNLIDRITIGHVIDFISVGNFAVFNVADSSITLGVIVLILGVWLQERQQKRQNADSSPGSSPEGERPSIE